MTRRGLSFLLPVVLLAATLAGCGGGDDPLSRTQPYDPDKPQTGGAPGAPGAPGATGAAEPAPTPVAHPWRKGMRQHGIAVYWERNPQDSDQTVRAKAQKILDWVVSTGANSMSLSFSFTMTGLNGSVVKTDHPMTPTPSQVGIVLDEARKRKLRAAVRPMLSEKGITEGHPKAWRGTIAPADKEQWFDTYAEMIAQYAKPAETFDAAAIVIGTELNSMERDKRWSRVTKAAAKIFHGELGYSANHDRLPGSMPIDGVVKSVDAYPPVDLPDTATVPEITAELNKWLAANTIGATPNLVLAEVAISAHGGAYKKPFSTAADGVLVPQIQQRWFDAACALMHKRNLGGMYFWMINLDADPRTAKPTAAAPMDFVGGPAEKNVRACFKQSAERKP
jgi:hypothetical protein